MLFQQVDGVTFEDVKDAFENELDGTSQVDIDFNSTHRLMLKYWIRRGMELC